MNLVETDMAEDTEKTDEAKAETDETLEEQVEALKEEVGEAAKAAANVIERFFDVSFGAGAVAAEKIDTNLRRLWDDAPGLIEELEQKGRPVREKLTDALRGKMPAGATTSASSGEDEITTLENRVKELELEVGGEEPKEPSRVNMLELDTDDAKPKPRRSKKTEESAPE